MPDGITLVLSDTRVEMEGKLKRKRKKLKIRTPSFSLLREI
jgi:hypothetical protein